VRWVPGVRDQRAWLFIPDDPRLRAWASLIAEQRRHSLTHAERESFQNGQVEADDDEDLAQLSMFAPLSAVATETAASSPWDERLPALWSDGDQRIEVELAELPLLAASAGAEEPVATRRETKDALRLANANAARDVARKTGLSHAQVNAELNRRAGVRRITEATVAQLEGRLKQAERWLAAL